MCATTSLWSGPYVSGARRLHPGPAGQIFFSLSSLASAQNRALPAGALAGEGPRGGARGGGAAVPRRAVTAGSRVATRPARGAARHGGGARPWLLLTGGGEGRLRRG